MHISESTRAGYRTAVQSLAAFCERERIQLSFPISPDTLCLWIADRASSLRFTTIRNYLHGINTTHIELGYKSPLSESPLVWKMYKAVKRLQGTDSTSMRLPITVELLKRNSYLRLVEICMSRGHNFTPKSCFTSLRRNSKLSFPCADQQLSIHAAVYQHNVQMRTSANDPSV
jgi:hypothetical protein